MKDKKLKNILINIYHYIYQSIDRFVEKPIFTKIYYNLIQLLRLIYRLGCFFKKTKYFINLKNTYYFFKQPQNTKYPKLFIFTIFMINITCTPAFVIEVNGEIIGVARDSKMVETIIDQASKKLETVDGSSLDVDDINTKRTYTIVNNIDENKLLIDNLIQEVVGIEKKYILEVDGQKIAATEKKETYEEVFKELAKPYFNVNTVDYKLQQDVKIHYDFTTPEIIQNDQEIIEKLKSYKEVNGEYTIVAGDTTSEIASNHDMSLDDIVTLNPGIDLELIGIDDVINVYQQIPFISFETVEEVAYQSTIEAPIEYVDDASLYVGETAVVNAGSSGLGDIDAKVTYVNGIETKREILKSKVITDPVAKVIANGTKERPKTASYGSYHWPASGRLTSKFGYRELLGMTFHNGIDIAAPVGTSILAADGGKVISVGWKSALGYTIVIRHDNGHETIYAHLSTMEVSVGEFVYRGQRIAGMGNTGLSTGPHLHFGLRINGTYVDPLKYL